jgi:hypothetical protein
MAQDLLAVFSKKNATSEDPRSQGSKTQASRRTQLAFKAFRFN